MENTKNMGPTPVTIILEQKENIKKLHKMLLSKPCGSERVNRIFFWQGCGQLKVQLLCSLCIAEKLIK